MQLYKKYVSKCPKSALEKDSFYLTPKRKYNSSDEGTYCYIFTSKFITRNIAKLYITILKIIRFVVFELLFSFLICNISLMFL